MSYAHKDFENVPLGKGVSYPKNYDKMLLETIPRKLGRDAAGIRGAIPFKGYDLWNAYEISWLNKKGKPQIAMFRFIYNCNNALLVESKSLKLYLQSFCEEKFDSQKEVLKLITQDLNKLLQTKIIAMMPDLKNNIKTVSPPGICIDEQDIEIPQYEFVKRDLLKNADIKFAAQKEVTETLHSNLLKTNCLITNQPDWATVVITYQGKKICEESLLKYLVSFRNHCEFHEQCVERIFYDIMKRCSPLQLTVYARFTRRGGIDINPIRSTQDISIPTDMRYIRQ